MTCSVLDHSDYHVTNMYWNSLERGPEKSYCNSCMLPTFETWFKRIDWKWNNKEYWRKIFYEAEHCNRYFWYKNEPRPSLQLLRGDESEDSPPIVNKLVPHRPWGGVDSGRTKNLIQYIRLVRYQKRLPQRKENFYPDHQHQILSCLNFSAEDRDYVNNRRWALVSSRKDMKRYRKQREDGCCGSHDEIVTIGFFPPKKYTIGFNYGH